MRLLTCKIQGEEQVCLQTHDEEWVYPISFFGLSYSTMNDLIRGISESEKMLLYTAEKEKKPCGIRYADVEKQAPIPFPVGNVICLGENYRKHAIESYRFQKVKYDGVQSTAVYFDKKVLRALGDGEVIDGHLDFVTQLDYEVELAVILGKDAFCVSKEEAASYIFGYSVANDVSARDVQYRHKQNYLGKSLDTFFAMGPVIVTADEFDCPPVLPIHCWVNGELRQDSMTDQVFFDICHIISELSQGMTLPCGTIIITGTPAGVGMGMNPPCFLKRGDLVQCEIAGIGNITNQIR